MTGDPVTAPSVPTAEEFAKAREDAKELRQWATMALLNPHKYHERLTAILAMENTVLDSLASAEAAIGRLQEELAFTVNVRLGACRDENQRLSKEAARIDWLEARGAFAIQYDLGYREYNFWNESGPSSERGIIGVGQTVREAIDAAMSAGVSPPESEKP